MIDTEDMPVETLEEAQTRRARRRTRRASAPVVAAPDNQEEQGAVPEGAVPFSIDVPEAPPIEKPSFLDKARDRLGLGTPKNVEPQQRSPRLTKTQQDLLDLAAPIARDLGIEGARFAWSRIANRDYARVLEPSEEEATKMMLPLARILVRQLKFTGRVTPNSADAAASLLAVIGYSWSSWRLYRAMKEEEYYGSRTQEESTTNNVRHLRRSKRPEHAESEATYAPAAAVSVPAALQNGARHGGGAVQATSTVGGVVDIGNLTPAERQQYERLAALSRKDIEARSRRRNQP